MKIKRYVVRDMTEAMRLIKADLGSEAVIISSRKVRSRGLVGYFTPRRLEVTAARDEPPVCSGRPARQARETVAVAGGGLSADQTGRWSRPTTDDRPPTTKISSPAWPADRSAPDKAPVTQLHRELSEIKELLSRFSPHTQSACGVNLESDETFFGAWQRFLEDMEIQPEFTVRLMTELRRQVDSNDIQRNDLARVCLQNEIVRLVESIYAEQGQNRILAFIGPTGVGKTTTLVKMAAQYTLFDGKNCAIITIDTYRIGAVEQLKIYAEIMGVPLEIAMTPPDFQEAVHRHRNKDFIFVDTAGRPSRSGEKMAELRAYFDSLDEPVDIVLVLSSNTKHRDLISSVQHFNQVKYSRLIFTKVDETDTLGCILNIIGYTGLPVTQITDGQNVPDDIQRLYPKKLAKLLTRGWEPDA
jgi:flagellar biosynthesis protein FlhF